jgi:glycosyltransferase involved in cell wall biosynthesis
MAARVSVIIPCYNQGHFLKDALDSLAACDPGTFETIIVNDGSTDSKTLEYLQQLKKEGFHIIDQLNGGLCAARNTGILASIGDYVIMLDSDNRIRPVFITKGKAAMDADPAIGVVYGNAEYFGDKKGIRKQEPFNLQKQLLVNYIDACGMIRKSVFEKVGFYDVNMKQGWEDWEMWLRIAFHGYKFFYIDDLLYDYRVREDSMSKGVYDSIAKTNSVENYVYGKYPDKMGIQYVANFMVDRFKKRPFHFLVKLFIRTYMPGYYNKLLKENRIRNGL